MRRPSSFLHRAPLIAIGALAVALFVGCGGPGRGSGEAVASDAGPVGSPITVSFSTAGRHQTLVGFGAAAAYYTNYLSDRRIAGDDIFNVLFVDLGLDMLRIANWYQTQSVSGTTASTSFTDNAVVNIVEKATAARMGAPLALLMSAWSPPAYLKSTGLTKPMTACDAGACQGTLIRDGNGAFEYEPLGQWWVAALQAYASRGVAPDYISVQNEPDFFSNNWETCRYDTAEGTNAAYATALDAVYAAVQASALDKKPTFIGPETSGQRRLTNHIAAMANLSEIGAIAHHLYNGGAPNVDNPPPDSFIAAMGMIAAAANTAQKPIFVTEYSPPKPTMFDTAWLIHNALTVEGVSAYVYWELFWAAPTNGVPTGLVTLDNPSALTNPKGYKINDIYYAVKHFAKWTDPGDVRIDATASDPIVKVSGFLAPDESRLTLVILNTDANARSVALDASGYTFGAEAIYRTSGTTERTESMPVAGDNTLVMPARSIATVTFTR